MRLREEKAEATMMPCVCVCVWRGCGIVYISQIAKVLTLGKEWVKSIVAGHDLQLIDQSFNQSID